MHAAQKKKKKKNLFLSVGAPADVALNTRPDRPSKQSAQSDRGSMGPEGRILHSDAQCPNEVTCMRWLVLPEPSNVSFAIVRAHFVNNCCSGCFHSTECRPVQPTWPCWEYPRVARCSCGSSVQCRNKVVLC